MAVNWEIVEREVHDTVRRRVAADVARDITQTTMARAVAHEPAGWETIDAVRWSVRVALNIAVDERRRRRAEPCAEVPDTVTAVDVEQDVLSRLDLERVADALEQLDERDRRLVLGYDAGGGDRRARVRIAVARHRARERLRKLAGDVDEWIVLRSPLRRMRRLSDLYDSGGGQRIAGIVVAVAAMASATAVVTRHGDVLSAASVSARVPRAVATVVADLTGDTSHGVTTSAPGPTAPTPRSKRPAWARRGDGRERGHIDDPTGTGDELWYWEDDPQQQDDPVVCVWNAGTNTQICTPITWGDVQDHSPVSVPQPPW